VCKSYSMDSLLLSKIQLETKFKKVPNLSKSTYQMKLCAKKTKFFWIANKVFVWSLIFFVLILSLVFFNNRMFNLTKSTKVAFLVATIYFIFKE
jgi:hypothetical protein